MTIPEMAAGSPRQRLFEYLSNEERKERYLALGSNQHVRVKSPGLAGQRNTRMNYVVMP